MVLYDCWLHQAKLETGPTMTIFPSNDQFIPAVQFSVAVWSDDPGSDNQTLIETLVEMREVVGTVVDIIVAHCLSLMTQNRRQTMGRLVAGLVPS